MKNFLKQKWQYVLAAFIAIFAVSAYIYGVNFSSVRADSGWDSSYDGGGGGSWSSSSSSSDWSSSSWSSSSSSSSSSGDPGDAFATLVFFIIIIVIVYIISRASAKNAGSATKNAVMRADISEDEIKKLLPNETLGSLKHMAFENFVAIQNAWMEFDYDKLRELCTDELYNTYTSQLDTLKIKNGKNVMSDFDQEEIKIIGIKKQDKLVTVEVYLRITFYDYVINQKSKEVIRGTKDHKLTNNYEMQFVRKQDNSKKKTKCPNCGAEIDTVTSTKCEYCGSTIVVDANEFVLSKKTNINR